MRWATCLALALAWPCVPWPSQAQAQCPTGFLPSRPGQAPAAPTDLCLHPHAPAEATYTLGLCPHSQHTLDEPVWHDNFILKQGQQGWPCWKGQASHGHGGHGGARSFTDAPRSPTTHHADAVAQLGMASRGSLSSPQDRQDGAGVRGTLLGGPALVFQLGGEGLWASLSESPAGPGQPHRGILRGGSGLLVSRGLRSPPFEGLQT